MTSRDEYLENFSSLSLYNLPQVEKEKVLLKELNFLTQHHARHCLAYSYLINNFGYKEENKQIEKVPFFSLRAFKELELLSIDKRDIVKTMTSSGTSGQAVSKIFLDNDTARLQSKVLTRLMRDILGPKRIPLLILDSPSVVKQRDQFSARGAGIIGFSFYGKNVSYALDDEYRLDINKVRSFFAEHAGQQVFIFGFTFMVWKYFLANDLISSLDIDAPNSVLLHGGGWKKLIEEAVDGRQFRERAREVLKSDNVINYYGLVEQTGSLYFECDQGFLHPSIYSDIIIRNPETLESQPIGVPGVVQVISCIPRSYPGHSLLTDDVGVVHGVDDCTCGKRGKYFSISGRLKSVEIRGCSDAV